MLLSGGDELKTKSHLTRQEQTIHSRGYFFVSRKLISGKSAFESCENVYLRVSEPASGIGGGGIRACFRTNRMLMSKKK